MGHSARTGAKIRRLGEFREGRSKVREREREGKRDVELYRKIG